MPEGRLVALLRALHEGQVDFIVVGGLAAVLNGAPVSTFDVDVVHSRESENVARLLTVLESLDAVFRIQPERRLKPAASHLASPGHLNLITRYGPLVMNYQDLLAHTVDMTAGENLPLRVLDLETLIAFKEALSGEKDRAVLPILRRTLQEKKNRP